jgi:hypothetical protein
LLVDDSRLVPRLFHRLDHHLLFGQLAFVDAFWRHGAVRDRVVAGVVDLNGFLSPSSGDAPGEGAEKEIRGKIKGKMESAKLLGAVLTGLVTVVPGVPKDMIPAAASTVTAAARAASGFAGIGASGRRFGAPYSRLFCSRNSLIVGKLWPNRNWQYSLGVLAIAILFCISLTYVYGRWTRPIVGAED